MSFGLWQLLTREAADDILHRTTSAPYYTVPLLRASQREYTDKAEFCDNAALFPCSSSF